ncbi:class I SAM-dependent methyltransferase [Candidatus Albibeggiatoa sp. nov. NOAA]|uniref:class I SAM-dependent methyltransferase n=1 Tax=Candidatus Albibeggiatoa sp. nov. NOAA TaxID=3162724 RepID=UPI00330344F7|nr:class I SAM-dependent methyltransferase [Thiotrichaceae bacterium]
MNNIPIYCSQTDLQPQAQRLAAQFNFPLVETISTASNQLYLELNQQHLALHSNTEKTQGVYVDFVQGKLGYRREHNCGRNQPLPRAIGLKKHKHLKVLDATAGLGRDAFVLAVLGCQVTMMERSPVLAALLTDGLQRLEQQAELKVIWDNMRLIHQPTQDYLQNLDSESYPDVVYLDPMYPHRQKSALVKKEMRFIRQVVGEDHDSYDVLAIALQRVKQRVVVKRPKGAPLLSANGEDVPEIKPHTQVESKNTRYDIYKP